MKEAPRGVAPWGMPPLSDPEGGYLRSILSNLSVVVVPAPVKRDFCCIISTAVFKVSPCSSIYFLDLFLFFVQSFSIFSSLLPSSFSNSVYFISSSLIFSVLYSIYTLLSFAFLLYFPHLLPFQCFSSLNYNYAIFFSLTFSFTLNLLPSLFFILIFFHFQSFSLFFLFPCSHF